MEVLERPVPSAVEASQSTVAESETRLEAPPQTLSKSAIKKAAKAERHAAYKLVRRAREKEAKKEKKRMLAAKRAAGDLDEEEETRRQKKRPRMRFGGKVVIDLGFDNMMNEKEIISLCSQLAYTYSANRSAGFPFHLVYSSLNGRTFQRLEGMNEAGYQRWANTEWWHEGYEQLWRGRGAPFLAEEDPFHRAGCQEAEPVLTHPSTSQKQPSEKDIQRNIVYLTADSEEELTELKPGETYIIGGICDHNRYKNLCLNKARESGIRSARLPIGRYLASLPTRKVLTVNQVFEILLKWVETMDWEEALHSVVPKRKFQKSGADATVPGSRMKDSDVEEVKQEGDPESTDSAIVKEPEQE